jgi:Flp pilus assembly protein TadB
MAGRAGWPLVLGIFLLALAVSIPFLGLLVSIVATVFGLGALWLLARERLQRPKVEAAGQSPS